MPIHTGRSPPPARAHPDEEIAGRRNAGQHSAAKTAAQRGAQHGYREVVAMHMVGRLGPGGKGSCKGMGKGSSKGLGKGQGKGSGKGQGKGSGKGQGKGKGGATLVRAMCAPASFCAISAPAVLKYALRAKRISYGRIAENDVFSSVDYEPPRTAL